MHKTDSKELNGIQKNGVFRKIKHKTIWELDNLD